MTRDITLMSGGEKKHNSWAQMQNFKGAFQRASPTKGLLFVQLEDERNISNISISITDTRYVSRPQNFVLWLNWNYYSNIVKAEALFLIWPFIFGWREMQSSPYNSPWRPRGIARSSYFTFLFLTCTTAQCGPGPPHSLRFVDHAQWHATVGRTPLDEGSARRRDLYLKTHNTQNGETPMPPAGFEPAIPTSDRP